MRPSRDTPAPDLGPGILVRVEFTAGIRPWSEGALNSIDGFMDFDFDDDPATGLSAMIGGTNRWITDLVPGSGHYRVAAR